MSNTNAPGTGIGRMGWVSEMFERAEIAINAARLDIAHAKKHGTRRGTHSLGPEFATGWARNAYAEHI